MVTDNEVRRALSPSERWYWICDQLSVLNVIARVRLQGALAPDTLRAAADALSQEHPLLRVSISCQSNGTSPTFVAPQDPEIPIRAVDGQTTWEQEVDTVELNTALDWATRPLARITDIRHRLGEHAEAHDLVFTVSHVIADGTTAMTLLRRLVELAAGEAIRPRHAMPAPDSLLPRAFRPPFGLLSAVGAGLAEQAVALAQRPKRLRPEVRVDPSARRSRLLSRELKGDQLAALTRRCRAEGVTVHGALTAAIARAYGTVIAPGTVGKVGIGSPIDFRGDLWPTITQEDAGAFVATVPSYLRYGPGTDLWDVAHALNRQLARRKRQRAHLAQIAMLPAICPTSANASGRAVDLVDSRGPGNLCISNIGRYDFPDRTGNWELTGAQFIAGISISGCFVASVNTSHDVLQWNFTYIEDIISADRATRLADESLHALLAELELPAPIAIGK